MKVFSLLLEVSESWGEDELFECLLGLLLLLLYSLLSHSWSVLAQTPWILSNSGFGSWISDLDCRVLSSSLLQGRRWLLYFARSRIVFDLGSWFGRSFGKILKHIARIIRRSNRSLWMVEVEELEPVVIAHSLFHVGQPKDVDSEVSISKVLVAVLNHETWRRIKVVVDGVLRVVPVKGWESRCGKTGLHSHRVGVGCKCFHDKNVRSRAFISRRFIGLGSLFEFVLRVRSKPHLISEPILIHLTIWARSTPHVAIHIACSSGSEGFLKVDLLAISRSMVHSLIAELFRAVNEERNILLVDLQDKGMNLLSCLSCGCFIPYFELNNHKETRLFDGHSNVSQLLKKAPVLISEKFIQVLCIPFSLQLETMKNSSLVKVNLVPVLAIFQWKCIAFDHSFHCCLVLADEERVEHTHSQELLNVPEVRSSNVVVDSMNNASDLTLVCHSSKQTNLLLWRVSESKFNPRLVEHVLGINSVDIDKVRMKFDLAELKVTLLFIPLHPSGRWLWSWWGDSILNYAWVAR